MRSPRLAIARRGVVSVLTTLAFGSRQPWPAFAGVEPGYNPGETSDVLRDSLGGLKPGTGRPLNALIKMRSETGVDRISTNSPLFRPGQILDELRTAHGGVAQIVFAFPPDWTLAGGPNLDVRDVRQSDSAYVLVAPLPPRFTIDRLTDEWFMDVLFDPAGKYGQYGVVEDRKVLSSSLVSLNAGDGRGGKQGYRKLALKFAPLSYNANTVERRALLSATEVGGSVFIFVSGSLATRYKKLLPELMAAQDSFRAFAISGSVAPKNPSS